MRAFTEGHERVLDKLATYRLLSVKQMQAAGAGRDARHLRGLVQELHAHKLLRTLPNVNRKGEAAVVRFNPRVGRRPLLYYLTPKGAQAWADLTGLPAPTVRAKPYLFNSKVEEWEAITETRLALVNWAASAGARLDFFQADFEPGADDLNRSTRIPFEDTTQPIPAADSYTPDALAGLRLADERPALLTVEVYMGGWQSRLEHFRKQVPHLQTVASLAVPEKAYSLDKLGQAARYLVLFRDDDMREAALKGWPDSQSRLWGRFFIKSLPELADFNADWWQPNGARRALFR